MWDMETRDTYSLLVGSQTHLVTMDISVEASQKSKVYNMVQQYHSQEYRKGIYILVQRYALPSMFSFVQCTVARKRKQPICLPTDEQIIRYDS